MRYVVVSQADLGGRSASLVAETTHAAVAERGICTVAFSGGATPEPMFRALVGADVPWEKVHVFQVDERVAPDRDPARNLAQLRHLLERVPVAHVHAMDVGGAHLEAAAENYAQRLRAHAGDPPRLDLVHLGLGVDGHTASLFPGDAATSVEDRDVTVTGPQQGYRRMTLTLPALNRARRVLWLVSGVEKAAAARRLMAGDRRIPAGRVRVADAVLVIDTDVVDSE